MAPAWQTLEHRPHSPVLKWMQFSRSITGTRGEAWGWARSMHGRALKYLSKSVMWGCIRRSVIVARSTAPVGQTNAQAPHAWHWFVRSSKAVRTSRDVPRPYRLTAPRPITSLHTRAQRPQRTHLPSAAGGNGVDATPSPAAKSASSRESGAWARSSSSIVRRDSATFSVSVWTTRLFSTGWLHDATICRPRGVSISTRHTRQAPYGDRPR